MPPRSAALIPILAVLVVLPGAAWGKGGQSKRDGRIERRVERMGDSALYKLALKSIDDVMDRGIENMADPRIQKAVGGMVDQMLNQVAGQMKGELPALSAAARQTVVDTTTDVMAKVLSDENLGTVEDAAAELAIRLATDVSPVMLRELRTAIDTLSPEVAESLRDDLGPAMGEVLRKDLMPAFVAGLADDAFNEAAHRASYSVASGALDATADALKPEGELGRVLKQQREDTMADIRTTMKDVSDEAKQTGVFLARVLGILASVLGVVAAVLIYAWSRAKKAADEREQALGLMAWRIQVEATERDDVRGMVDRIHDFAKEDTRGSHLKAFFVRNPHFNIRKAGGVISARKDLR